MSLLRNFQSLCLSIIKRAAESQRLEATSSSRMIGVNLGRVQSPTETNSSSGKQIAGDN